MIHLTKMNAEHSPHYHLKVGIAFILREIFIGLYDHSIEWTEILALTGLLAVLVAARIAAVQFQPRANHPE